MKRQIFSALILSLFAASFVTACDDDSKEEKKTVTECNCSCKTDTACTCDKSCVNDQDCKTADCKNDDKDDDTNNDVDPNASIEDFATPSGSNCAQSFEEFCDGETAHICEDGKEILRDCAGFAKKSGRSVTCQVSTVSKYADCVETCAAGAKDFSTCDGKYVELHACEAAKSGGTYEFAYTDDACAEACQDGACVTAETGIKDGAPCTNSTCLNDDVYNCVGGKYVKTACSQNTTCIPKDDKSFKCGEVLAEDSPCDSDDFVDFCKDNSLYYCSTKTNTVTVDGCKYQCHYLADGYGYTNYAECVTPCSEGDEPIEQCVGKDEKAYSDNYYCYPAKDGGFWYFPIQERCTNGCNDEKTNCRE